MKSVKTLVVALLGMALLVSCSSSKQNDSFTVEDGDSYSVAASEKITEEDFYEDEDTVTENQEKAVPAEKKSGFFASFFASKYVDIGEGSFFIRKYFGGMNQVVNTYVYMPKKNLSGYGSSYQGAFYYVLLDQNNRKALLSSMKKYLKDFEEKKLDRNNKKSYKNYGKIKARLNWGTLKNSTSYYADDVVVNIGYEFVDKSPYFLVQIYPTYNQNKDVIASEAENVSSLKLEYFFTKNQIKAFMENLSDENLSSYMNIETDSMIEDESFTGDEY